MRSEYLIQMLLFSPEVFAFTCFSQPKEVAIKIQTRICVRDPNRSVIDAEKELVGFLLPARIAFARRKIDDLQIVLVGITEIKRFDSSRGLNRRRQRLRCCRNELH